MKTYQAFLQSSQSFGEEKITHKKPVFRSSAIFPFLLDRGTKTYVHFMGYWLFKRKIKEISVLYTIRDEAGNIQKRDTIFVDRVKGFLIDVQKELAGFPSPPLHGSIEMEVFSARDMVFPYPAFVLEYMSRQGSSFVHTAGRVYNDLEDMKENEAFEVAETGFDILPHENSVGYFSFVNGASASPHAELKIEVVNALGNTERDVLRFDDLRPFEARTICLGGFAPDFVRGNKLFARINHNLQGVFPRFIAGNMDANREFVTLTHTYYDTSRCTGEDHYWKNPDPKAFYDASIYVPVFGGHRFETQLAIYPIHTPHAFNYSITAFAADGTQLDVPPRNGEFNATHGRAAYIDLSKSATDEVFGARIDIEGGGKIPARVKFGLNVAYRGERGAIPCNICFNAEPPNPKLMAKPGTAKWAPIPNRHRSVVTINNATFIKDYRRKANLRLSFWRLEDDALLVRHQEVMPNGFHVIDTKSDGELVSFLKGAPGWVTIESDNPVVNAWYFEISASGVVGADHSF